MTLGNPVRGMDQNTQGKGVNPGRASIDIKKADIAVTTKVMISRRGNEVMKCLITMKPSARTQSAVQVCLDTEILN